ncbi:MAG: hypothetical protein VYE22_16250 [Myxococcota bacterium]|nr:hypothetical protein [Myxococcota bacterium]
MKKLSIILAFAALAVGCGNIGGTYEECYSDNTCDRAVDQCFSVSIPAEATSGDFCSRVCSSDFDCDGNRGWGGVCYSLGSDPTPICFQQCDFNSDCEFSSVCIEVSLGGGVVDFICVPDN